MSFASAYISRRMGVNVRITRSGSVVSIAVLWVAGRLEGVGEGWKWWGADVDGGFVTCEGLRKGK